MELRSSSDTLKSLQDKLEEYLQNGAQLGLLVDRKNRTIHVYRPHVDPEVLENPEFVSCEPELPGLTLKMARIW